MPGNQDKQKSGVVRALSFSSQIGLTLVACVLIGVFLGRFLDDCFDTSPLLLLLFSLLGVAAAFRSIFSLAKRNEDKQ